MSELPIGWVLADVGTVTSNITDGTHAPPAREPDGVPLLSAKDITDYGVRPRGSRFVSHAYFEAERKRTRLAADDVLLTIVGSIGRSTLVPPNPQFALQRSVAILKPSGVTAKFLSYYLQTPQAFRYYAAQARGTAQQGLYLRHLKQLPVPVPPPPEQRRIIAAVEEQFSRLDAGVVALERVIGPLTNTQAGRVGQLRSAILAAAFSGTLVPQDTNDKSASALLDRIVSGRASSNGHKPACTPRPKASNPGPDDAEHERRMGIQLMWEDGYSKAEIAETMEISPTQLGSEITRMRREGWNLPRRRRKATA